MFDPGHPVIVQGDGSFLVDAHQKRYERRAWLDASDITTDVEQSFALDRIAAIRAVPE